MDEVASRFGSASQRRLRASRTLLRLWELAKRTGHLERIVIFGSFVTAKEEPNDVDLILVMDDNFRVDECDQETATLFDHARAQHEHEASVFWIRPSLLINDTLKDFIQRWQRKRDGALRGIVEVMND
jgi:hypothetical protein